MKLLSVHETHYSPQILFDNETGLIEIKGKSLPDDAHSFYEPLLQWIEDYSENPQPKTTVNMHFAYFNTSSSKNILEIFKKLAVIKNKGFEVEVNWHYEFEEEDMLEAGQDYQAIVKIPFNLIGYNR